MVCNLFILFVYYFLVGVAEMFEFAMFSLIVTYFVYSVRIIDGYEHDDYAEYLA